MTTPPPPSRSLEALSPRAGLRRYYLAMATAAVVAAAYDSGYYLLTQTKAHGSRAVAVVSLSLSIFLVLNLVGATRIVRPLAMAFAANGDAAAAAKRAERLAALSALWILTLGLFYTVIAVVAEGLEELGNPGIVSRLSLAGPMVLAYGVFLPFFTFFLVEDVAIDLRLALAARLGVRFERGSGKLWRRLSFAFVVAALLPQAQLLVDMMADPRRTFGTGFWRAVALDVTLALVGIVVAIVFVARGLRRPTELLMKALARVKGGDLTAEAPVVTRDEIGHLTADFNDMVAGLRERERIREAFGRYLEKDVADTVLARGAALSGEVRTATILVTDIEGYSTLAEAMSPGEVVAMLNDYFEVLVECVRRRQGIVNKFIGDSVMALYNVPLDDPEHARHAIETALDIARRTRERRFGPRQVELRTRVGVNTGLVVAGSIGAAERLEYTVIGDTVNVAARLEQLNKEHGTTLLVGAQTRQEAGAAFEFDQVGDVVLKGKAQAVAVFTVGRPPRD